MPLATKFQVGDKVRKVKDGALGYESQDWSKYVEMGEVVTVEEVDKSGDIRLVEKPYWQHPDHYELLEPEVEIPTLDKFGKVTKTVTRKKTGQVEPDPYLPTVIQHIKGYKKQMRAKEGRGTRLRLSDPALETEGFWGYIEIFAPGELKGDTGRIDKIREKLKQEGYTIDDRNNVIVLSDKKLVQGVESYTKYAKSWIDKGLESGVGDIAGLPPKSPEEEAYTGEPIDLEEGKEYPQEWNPLESEDWGEIAIPKYYHNEQSREFANWLMTPIGEQIKGDKGILNQVILNLNEMGYGIDIGEGTADTGSQSEPAKSPGLTDVQKDEILDKLSVLQKKKREIGLNEAEQTEYDKYSQMLREGSIKDKRKIKELREKIVGRLKLYQLDPDEVYLVKTDIVTAMVEGTPMALIVDKGRESDVLYELYNKYVMAMKGVDYVLTACKSEIPEKNKRRILIYKKGIEEKDGQKRKLSERGIGKRLGGWDELEIAEGEIEYITTEGGILERVHIIEDNEELMEIWEQSNEDTDVFYSKVKEKGLWEVFEKIVHDYILEDTDTFSWAWDDTVDNLTELLTERSEDGEWAVTGENMGWLHRSGWKEVHLETGKDIVKEILPKTDVTFYVYDYRNGEGLAINNYHHDSPTGEWYYLLPKLAVLKIPTLDKFGQTIIRDNEGKEIHVGDTVKFLSDGVETIVRHIGRLEGDGYENSIWGEWEKKWDGKLKSTAKGGVLTFSRPAHVIKIEDGSIPDIDIPVLEKFGVVVHGREGDTGGEVVTDRLDKEDNKKNRKRDWTEKRINPKSDKLHDQGAEWDNDKGNTDGEDDKGYNRLNIAQKGLQIGDTVRFTVDNAYTYSYEQIERRGFFTIDPGKYDKEWIEDTNFLGKTGIIKDIYNKYILIVEVENHQVVVEKYWVEKIEDSIETDIPTLDKFGKKVVGEYQGWANYETWNLALWVGNDEGAYNYMIDHRPYTKEKAKIIGNQMFPTGTPDMRRGDMRKVNWEAIAEAWNGEDEPEPDEPDIPTLDKFGKRVKGQEEKYYDFGYEIGHKAGKTDGWMDMENTIPETWEDRKRYGLENDPSELVLQDFQLWQETEHWAVYYQRPFNNKIEEDGIGGEDTIEKVYEYQDGFLEGYDTGRKSIGIDIYDIADKVIKGEPIPEPGELDIPTLDKFGKREFRIGDNVKIVDVGRNYSGDETSANFKFAIELGATKYTGIQIKEWLNKEGIIKNKGRGADSRIYLIDLGEIEVLMNVEGIEKVADVELDIPILDRFGQLEFKVGDRVRLKQDEKLAVELKAGMEGTIIDIEPSLLSKEDIEDLYGALREEFNVSVSPPSRTLPKYWIGVSWDNWTYGNDLDGKIPDNSGHDVHETDIEKIPIVETEINIPTLDRFGRVYENSYDFDKEVIPLNNEVAV